MSTKEIVKAYKSIKDPSELVKHMSFDDFCNWCDLGTKEDLQATLIAFDESGLEEHCKIIKYKIKKLIATESR